MASSEWDNAVNRLRQKALEFNRIYDLVVNSQSIAINDDILYEDYDSIRNKGDFIKGTIQRVTQLVDEVYRATNEIMGEENTGALIHNINTQSNSMNGLGFVIPLIPIAVVTSAIAAITYWVNDALKYLTKIEQVKNLINKDVNPKEAYEIVHGQAYSFKKYIPWAIGGVVTILMAPKLFRLIKG